MSLSRVLSIVLVHFFVCEYTFSQQEGKEVTHYILPDFVEGTVLMKNGRKNEVSINYNSLSEEMVFKKGSLKLAIGNTESELIDTVYMSDRKFVREGGQFMELLHQSEVTDLFVQYKCRMRAPGKSVGYGGTSQTAAVDNYQIKQQDPRFYELKLPDGYETRPYLVYWVKKEGVLKEIAGMNQLEKSFKKQKDEFRAYIKSNDVKFKDPLTIQALVRHLDTLQ